VNYGIDPKGFAMLPRALTCHPTIKATGADETFAAGRGVRSDNLMAFRPFAPTLCGHLQPVPGADPSTRERVEEAEGLEHERGMAAFEAPATRWLSADLGLVSFVTLA
jgi:hypothetical protein